MEVENLKHCYILYAIVTIFGDSLIEFSIFWRIIFRKREFLIKYEYVGIAMGTTTPRWAAMRHWGW